MCSILEQQREDHLILFGGTMTENTTLFSKKAPGMFESLGQRHFQFTLFSKKAPNMFESLGQRHFQFTLFSKKAPNMFESLGQRHFQSSAHDVKNDGDTCNATARLVGQFIMASNNSTKGL
jgi:hypothetical protein